MIKVLENEADFEKIIKEDKKVLVDFNATWCGPCRIMGRVMEDLEDERKDITFLKVDTDEFPSLAQDYGVMSIPTMVPFVDGKRIPASMEGSKQDVFLGSMPEETFKEALDETFGKVQ